MVGENQEGPIISGPKSDRLRQWLREAETTPWPLTDLDQVFREGLAKGGVITWGLEGGEERFLRLTLPPLDLPLYAEKGKLQTPLRTSDLIRGMEQAAKAIAASGDLKTLREKFLIGLVRRSYGSEEEVERSGVVKELLTQWEDRKGTLEIGMEVKGV